MSPEEKEKRRAEHYAVRERHKNVGMSLVVEEFGLPTVPNCQEWPHCLCTAWTLDNGVEIHVTAWTDGPTIAAHSAPDHLSPNGEKFAASTFPRVFVPRPSIRDWLKSIGFIKGPEAAKR